MTRYLVKRLLNFIPVLVLIGTGTVFGAEAETNSVSRNEEKAYVDAKKSSQKMADKEKSTEHDRSRESDTNREILDQLKRAQENRRLKGSFPGPSGY